MKVKLSTILGTARELHGFCVKEWDRITSYHLSMLLDVLSPHLKAHDKERAKLLSKYADKDEGGSILFLKGANGKETQEVSMSQNNRIAFNDEIISLEDGVEIDILLEPIKIKVKKDFVVKPIEIHNLKHFISFETIEEDNVAK